MSRPVRGDGSHAQGTPAKAEMRESERSEDALTKARQAMMLVNNQLTDLQVKAKEYEQRLHEEEAKRGIRISSTPPAKEEESWWDQLLAPFTGAAPFTPADVGLCCDSSDAPEQRQYKQSTFPRPLAFVPESTPERHNTLAYRDRMKRRWQDGEVNRPSLCSSFPPSPCLTLSFAANSVVDSRMISGFNRLSHHSGRLRLPVDKENDNASQRSMWQMSIGLVSARELPKRDVLELTQVVCCVSLLEADDADAACAGRCPHDVLHEMNFESEEDAIHEYCTFRTGVHFVTPQFVTKSNESDLPKHVFDPDFLETFAFQDLHPRLSFQNGEWRPRKSAGMKPILNGSQVVLLVSIHDVQMQGYSNALGFTLVPLGPCLGVKDGWYTLHAGPAAPRQGGTEHDSNDASAHGRCARRPLRSHSGALSSINLRITYAMGAPSSVLQQHAKGI